MQWLHTIAYFPAVTITSLYLIFGDQKSQWTHLLDETTIWLIVFFAPNVGLIAHTLGLNIFMFSAIWKRVRSKQHASDYWTTFVLYTIFAFYTHFFQITEGVEVIRSIYPLWRGTRSGLLWPALFYVTGMINDEDEPPFVDKEEKKEQATEEEDSKTEAENEDDEDEEDD